MQDYDINKDTQCIIENILKTPRESATASIIDSKPYVFEGFDADFVSSGELFKIEGPFYCPLFLQCTTRFESKQTTLV